MGKLKRREMEVEEKEGAASVSTSGCLYRIGCALLPKKVWFGGVEFVSRNWDLCCGICDGDFCLG